MNITIIFQFEFDGHNGQQKGESFDAGGQWFGALSFSRKIKSFQLRNPYGRSFGQEAS